MEKQEFFVNLSRDQPSDFVLDTAFRDGFL